MPLHLHLEPGVSFIVTRYIGVIEDEQLMAYYRDIYRRPDLEQFHTELVDLSEADMGRVSVEGLSDLAAFIDLELSHSDDVSTRTAIYAPHDLPFGVARMYEAWSSSSPEEVRVFRGRDEAIRWLNESAASR